MELGRWVKEVRHFDQATGYVTWLVASRVTA